MTFISDNNLNNSIQLSDLLEFGRDYCSDQLGRFFQNKYSPPALAVNKFEIPAKLVTKNEQDCFAICVMMNNHIVDIKYFDDILSDWKSEMNIDGISSEQRLNEINKLIHNQKLLSIIKSFKKINDEIVIGRCRGSEFNSMHDF